jgi:hypothetical protein
MKPEPVTVTDVPNDPKDGEKTTLGITVNVVDPVQPPVGMEVTVMVYVP